MRRPELVGNVVEIDEHLDLLAAWRGARHQHGVVQVVTVQGLVVVAGAGVFGPGLRRVQVDVVVLQQRLGQRQNAVVHGRQADLSARERESVDPVELVADETLVARIGAVMKPVGGGEQQVQLPYRRGQLLGGQETGKDDETIGLPSARRVFEVHRAMIDEVRWPGNHFSRSDTVVTGHGHKLETLT